MRRRGFLPLGRLIGLRPIFRGPNQRSYTSQRKKSRQYGYAPAPICPIHRCRLKYIGRQPYRFLSGPVPTWGCPVPGCGQQVQRPGLVA